MIGIEDSAMWIQSKLERRVQNDLLSTVQACIVSIQMIKVSVNQSALCVQVCVTFSTIKALFARYITNLNNSLRSVQEREQNGVFGGKRSKDSIPGSAVFTRNSEDFTQKRSSYIKNMMDVGGRRSPPLSPSFTNSSSDLNSVLEAETDNKGGDDGDTF